MSAQPVDLDRREPSAFGRFTRRALGIPGLILVYAVILLALIATSAPRETGDAGDYVAMAYNLSQGRPPALSVSDLADVHRYFQRWKTGYEAFPPSLLLDGEREGSDGRYDTQHFWFYSAAVAPVLAITDALDLHPNRAFTIINLLLLLLAAGVALRRLHPLTCALLFLGPILWWVDKAQTEAFTFSLLTIAMVWLPERPWWSFVCLGAAATENPPLAAVLAIAIVFAAVARAEWRRTRAFWIGAASGVALAALNPLYYLVHLGKLSSFVGVRTHVPTWAELKFPLFDLNYGLVFNAPVLCLVVLAAGLVVLVRRRLRAFDVLVSVASVPVLLVAFAQSPELASAGTPNMTRYALWLIPLAIPLLRQAEEGRVVRWRWLVPVVAASVAWSVAVSSPTKPDNHGGNPSALAAYVWRHDPGFDNPLAEVFYARIAHQASPLEPTATASCSKALIVYGEWARCPVGQVPAGCRKTPCYANRDGAHYDFVDAPLPGGAPPPDPAVANLTIATVPDLQIRGGPSFALSGSTIRSPAGPVLQIVPGRVSGTVESSEVVGTLAEFSGWAASQADDRPASLILLFAGSRFVGTAQPSVSRPDVAHSLGRPNLAESGFHFKLPLRYLQSADRRLPFRLFAAEGHVASPVGFVCTDNPPPDFGC